MEALEENTISLKKLKVGFIPADWKLVALKKLLKENRSIRYGIVQPGKYDPQGRYMVRGQDYSRGWVDPENLFKVSDEVELRYKNARLLKGDIILTIVGAGTGTVAIVPDWLNNANLTQTTARISIDEDKAHGLYCYYLLSSSYGKKLTYKNIKGGAQPGLNCGDIEKYPIPLPSINEQKKIVQILSTWDKAITYTQNLIEQLKLRKKGLMQQLLTGKKRLKGFDGEWNDSKLGNYFEERKEVDFDDLPLLSLGANGVYPQDQSEKKDTSSKDKSKYKRILPGDIGYNTMRMWQGRSALSQVEGIVSPAYTILKPRENANSTFFSYLFKLDRMIHKFYRNSQGMVSDTLLCKYKDFSIVKFRAPSSLDEQNAISQILETADLEISQLQIKVESLQSAKKGLMQKLLTGQMRVQT